MKIIVAHRSSFAPICAYFCISYSLIEYKEDSFLEIDFVDKKEIRKLNKRFRGKDRPTDVLAFRGDGQWFGSVVLCKECMRRGMFHKTVIHGVLHVCGYDHEVEKNAKVMEELEEKIYQEVCGYLAFNRLD